MVNQAEASAGQKNALTQSTKDLQVKYDDLKLRFDALGMEYNQQARKVDNLASEINYMTMRLSNLKETLALKMVEETAAMEKQRVELAKAHTEYVRILNENKLINQDLVAERTAFQTEKTKFENRVAEMEAEFKRRDEEVTANQKTISDTFKKLELEREKLGDLALNSKTEVRKAEAARAELNMERGRFSKTQEAFIKAQEMYENEKARFAEEMAFKRADFDKTTEAVANENKSRKEALDTRETELKLFQARLSSQAKLHNMEAELKALGS